MHRVGDTMSTLGGVQCIGKISQVHWGDTKSTAGAVQYIEGIPWLVRGGYREYVFSTSWDYVGTFEDPTIHVDIMKKLGMFSALGSPM